MHHKLSYVHHQRQPKGTGLHPGTDFKLVPYYSPTLKELYHYTKGIFECHAAVNQEKGKISSEHSLKVIADDTVKTAVRLDGNKHLKRRDCNPKDPVE